MFKGIEVVDDFYSNPVRVRELALRTGEWSARGDSYSRETNNSFYTEGLIDRLERLVGNEIEVDAARMGFGVFAYYGGDVRVDHTTHFDDTDWSAVVYLVPNEYCSGGLTFYRHIATGLDGPPSDEDASALGFRRRAEFLEQFYYPDKERPEAWEETAYIGMRFNRMVLLRGSRLFHRAASGFGTSPDDGRLTQRFFFNDAHEEVNHA